MSKIDRTGKINVDFIFRNSTLIAVEVELNFLVRPSNFALHETNCLVVTPGQLKDTSNQDNHTNPNVLLHLRKEVPTSNRIVSH